MKTWTHLMETWQNKLKVQRNNIRSIFYNLKWNTKKKIMNSLEIINSYQRISKPLNKNINSKSTNLSNMSRKKNLTKSSLKSSMTPLKRKNL